MRNISKQAVSYEDIIKISDIALGLWKHAYRSSVNDCKPSSWRELFSDASLQKILNNLDITKIAQKYPLQDWQSYFDSQMLSIHSHAEKTLERHGAYLDPVILNALLSIVHYKHHEISTIRAYDRQAMIPRPTNLGGYILLNRKWLDAILVIHEWTVLAYPSLIGKGMDNIQPPCLFKPLVAHRELKAAFDKGAYEAQLRDFEIWQEKNLVSDEAVTTIH
jgi:hypothetical protein